MPLCVPDGYKERLERSGVLALLAISLTSSSKLKLTLTTSNFPKYSMFKLHSFLKNDILFLESENEHYAPVKGKSGIISTSVNPRYLVHEVCHQNLWAVWNELFHVGEKASFKCFLWGMAQTT